MTYRQLGKRVWDEIWKDEVFARAGELSYFFLFSLFPLLIIVTVLLGYLAQGADIRHALLSYFSRVMPRSAFGIVRDTLHQITEQAGGGKLSIGIVVTLWAASSGMASMIEGLNKAYEVREERPWWKARLLAAVLTVGLAVLTILAFLIVLYGSKVGGLMAGWLGLGEGFHAVWTYVRWPLAIGFLLLAFSIVYRFAPNLRVQRWRWILPGAVVAVAAWLLVSFGFRLYLAYFNSYSKLYGSLGALMILMLWLYLSGVAILVGAEVNSELENASARAGDPDAKLPGERAPHGSFVGEGNLRRRTG